MADKENPDRLALASHGIRELMERLPKYLGVDSAAYRVRFWDKFNTIAERWSRFGRLSGARGEDGLRSGHVDRRLAEFLKSADEFFDWYFSNKTNRREVVDQTLAKFEPSRTRLPSPIRKLGIDAWEQYHDYFVHAAHHASTDEQEFLAYQYGLETYLLERLRPRTFEDLAEIDALIREGESRD